MRNVGLTILGIGLAVLATSCGPGSSGKTGSGFTLSSSAIPKGGKIPVKYTCDGQDVSPPLNWKNPPPGTKSFGVYMEDITVNFFHWGIVNIPNTRTSLPEGYQDLNNTFQNDFGNYRYDGPCPPMPDPLNHTSHTYKFCVVALKVDRVTTEQEVNDNKIGEACFTAKYP